MPSPKRDSGSKIAYTRWEPLEAATEDVEATSFNNNNNNGNGSVPFHHFEQETEQQSTSKLRLSPRTLIINGRPPSSKRRSSEHHIKCWEWGVRILGILIVAGISWILGFMTRWGVHHYYIDSRGHCVTPVPYQYDHETAILIMEAIGQENIQKFFHEFTSVQSHLIGSIESENYANNISGNSLI